MTRFRAYAETTSETSTSTTMERMIAIHARHWKSERTEGQWRASMRDYVLPRLARKRVDAATTADVMAVLLPIWSTKRVTAGRVRQRIGAVISILRG